MSVSACTVYVWLTEDHLWESVLFFPETKLNSLGSALNHLDSLTLSFRSPPFPLEAGDEKCAPPRLICGAGDQAQGFKDARSWFHAFYQLSQLLGLTVNLDDGERLCACD